MAEAQQRLHEALERATALLNCPAALMTLARLTAVNAVKRVSGSGHQARSDRTTHHRRFRSRVSGGASRIDRRRG
jgi:hypothetical protein